MSEEIAPLNLSDEVLEQIRNQPYFLADPSAPHPELPPVGTVLTWETVREAIEKMMYPDWEQRAQQARNEIALFNALTKEETGSCQRITPR